MRDTCRRAMDQAREAAINKPSAMRTCSNSWVEKTARIIRPISDHVEHLGKYCKIFAPGQKFNGQRRDHRWPALTGLPVCSLVWSRKSLKSPAGRMAEWFKAAVLKSARVQIRHGFKSHPLRPNPLEAPRLQASPRTASMRMDLVGRDIDGVR